MSPTLQLSDLRAAALTGPIRKAANQLLSHQDPGGFWWGELTADTTLESDYILLQLWMHPPQGAVWNPPTRDLIGKAVKSVEFPHDQGPRQTFDVVSVEEPLRPSQR